MINVYEGYKTIFFNDKIWKYNEARCYTCTINTLTLFRGYMHACFKTRVHFICQDIDEICTRGSYCVKIIAVKTTLSCTLFLFSTRSSQKNGTLKKSLNNCGISWNNSWDCYVAYEEQRQTICTEFDTRDVVVRSHRSSMQFRCQL